MKNTIEFLHNFIWIGNNGDYSHDHELIQILVREIKKIKGPTGPTGEQILEKIEEVFEPTYRQQEEANSYASYA